MRNVPYEVAHACRNDCESADLLCDIICKDFKDESPAVFDACTGGCRNAGKEDCKRLAWVGGLQG